MEHCEKIENLFQWLDSAEAVQLHERDNQYVKALTQYLADPAHHQYVFLGGRIFEYAISLDHSNSLVSHVINIDITDACKQRERKHVFRLELRSISDFQHRFIACAGNVILVQFYTEPRKNKFDVLTFILRLTNNAVESVTGVPVVSRAYGGVTEDYFYFTDPYRPSVLSSLSIDTHAKKILKACFLKRWVAIAVVRPGKLELAGIVSEDKGLWENPSPSGMLVTFDVNRESVLTKREDIVACAELLQYSPLGDVLMAYQKLPSQVYFLDPDSLSTLKLFTFDQYYPFLQLPLKMPLFVDTLQENETLDYIPAGKVVLRNDSIRGLSLVGDKMRFLFPMVNRSDGIYAVAHLNLSCISGSMVDVMHSHVMVNNESDVHLTLPLNLSKNPELPSPDKTTINSQLVSLRYSNSKDIKEYTRDKKALCKKDSTIFEMVQGVEKHSGSIQKTMAKIDNNANHLLYNGENSYGECNSSNQLEKDSEFRSEINNNKSVIEQILKSGNNRVTFSDTRRVNDSNEIETVKANLRKTYERKKSLVRQSTHINSEDQNEGTQNKMKSDLVNHNAQMVQRGTTPKAFIQQTGNSTNDVTTCKLLGNNSMTCNSTELTREKLQGSISSSNVLGGDNLPVESGKIDSDEEPFDPYSIHSIIMNYASRKT